MSAYRLYYLDGTAKVASAEWIDAADEQAAIAIAREKCAARRCELWLGARLVARFGPDVPCDQPAA